MATKYDDFGRPIYETAEEYNRAKKAEKQYRTYTNTDGDTYKQSASNQKFRHATASQRHATVKGVRKTKSVVIGVLVSVLLVNVFVLFAGLSMYSDFESGVREEEVIDDWVVNEDEDVMGEYLATGEIPLPEGFETFSYKGQICTLPDTFKTITQMGLMADDYYEDDKIPSDFDEVITLYEEEGFSSVTVCVKNDEGTEILLEDCSVVYFCISNPRVYDETESVPDFVFCDGLTMESTYGEIEAYLGTPFYHYKDYSDEKNQYDLYEWAYYGDEETHFVSISFYNGVIADVCIEKSVNNLY